MRRLAPSLATIALIAAMDGAPTWAQPADPSGSPRLPAEPSGSPRPPADCAGLGALLPGDLGDGLALTVEVAAGVAGFEPEDMLDPFLGALGLGRDDVCSVGIRYGEPNPERIALLVRVRDAGPGLAERLAAALAERLRAYGNEVTAEASEVAGAAAQLLRISASGSETVLVLVDAMEDTALVSTSPELLAELLPLVPRPSGVPAPSPVPG